MNPKVWWVSLVVSCMSCPAWAQTRVPNLPPLSEIRVPDAPPVLPADPDQPVPDALPPLVTPGDPFEVQVQTTQSLRLVDAFELTIENNPQIQQARLDVQIAQVALDQEQTAYAPTLRTSGDLSYSQQINTNNLSTESIPLPPLLLPVAPGPGAIVLPQGVIPPQFDQDRLDYQGNIQINYRLFDGGFRDARTRTAALQIQIAQLGLEQLEQQVRLDVADAYYALQQEDTRVAIAEDTIRSSEANVRDAQAAFEAGFGTRFDVTRTETELANNQQLLQQSQGFQLQSRRRLVELLGLDPTADVTAADPIVPAAAWELSLEESIITAFQNREEFAVIQTQAAIATEDAEIARSGLRPQVDATAQVNFSKDLQIQGAFDVNYSLGIRYEMALLDGGVTRIGVRQAELRSERESLVFDETQRSIQRSVEDAFVSLTTDLGRIASARDSVVVAQESLELAQLRFQAGVGTQTEVISAEVALTQARANLSEAILGYNRALVQLQRATSGF